MLHANIKRLWGVLVLLPALISMWPPSGVPKVAASNPADSITVKPQLPAIPTRRFVATDYGAVGDGKHSNTEAFRKAIAAVKAAGGGQVVVPAGTFVTGPLELTSKMALVLEKGATIRGSEDFADYQTSDGKVIPLIAGRKLTDVAIKGEGTIDGAGAPWWKRFRAERAAGVPQQGQPRVAGQPQETPRPKLVLFTDCANILIQGITLKDAPQFHLVPQRCHDVTIENVTVTAPADSPNTDGIDPSSSREVLISHCTIDVGDDNVAFKSNPGDGPTENVLVTDCTFKHGHGASVGSNIGGGIRNILVQNCSFDGGDNGIRIKSARDRGGLVENIEYRNITMRNVGYAITLNLFYFDKVAQQERKASAVTATTPIVRGVRIVNVTVQGAKTAGDIIGLPEMPIDTVTLDNVRVDANTGLTVQDANGVILRQVHIVPQKGDPVKIINAQVKTQ
ncbi:MAG TPA: glycoside hydrolase family 28 protein [Pyrinomonadaceae bacterium]|nr:glycoside hydrolase family 28 protein [Pyrinomonadaceae bacterium]